MTAREVESSPSSRREAGMVVEQAWLFLKVVMEVQLMESILPSATLDALGDIRLGKLFARLPSFPVS